jgi:hypothetical protein
MCAAGLAARLTSHHLLGPTESSTNRQDRDSRLLDSPAGAALPLDLPHRLQGGTPNPLRFDAHLRLTGPAVLLEERYPHQPHSLAIAPGWPRLKPNAPAALLLVTGQALTTNVGVIGMLAMTANLTHFDSDSLPERAPVTE